MELQELASETCLWNGGIRWCCCSEFVATLRFFVFMLPSLHSKS